MSVEWEDTGKDRPMGDLAMKSMNDDDLCPHFYMLAIWLPHAGSMGLSR